MPRIFYSRHIIIQFIGMIISRIINGIEIDVDTSYGGIFFLDIEDIAKMQADGLNPSEITDILNYIYTKQNKYLPLMGTMELCSYCNFNCPFCYINTKEERKRHSYKTLLFEQIKEDIDWLIENGLFYLIITGGEVLINNQFEKIYKYLKTKGVIVSVFTNLSSLTNDLIDMFKENPPLKIEATIYGFEDETYYKTTGQRDFSAREFRDNVIELKRNGINVICKTPVNSLNFQDFEKIRKWCKENDIPYYFSEKIFETYYGKKMDEYKINTNNQKYILKERVGKLEVSNKNDIKRCFSCGAGKYGFFISHDYKLRPCMSFFDIEEANFIIRSGNIQKTFAYMNDFINKYKYKKLSDCVGCDAYEICKICVIDEIKKNNNLNEGYLDKCIRNSVILDYLSNR